MTHLDMPDDQAVQSSSAQIDDYRGARQLEKLKSELRCRVVRLRRQAYWFLAIAIFLLLGGVAVFGWANYIARFTLSPPETAASQYEKLTADKKRLTEQLDALNKQRQELLNVAAITDPYNEQIVKIKDEYMEDILRNCQKAILDKYPQPDDLIFGWSDPAMQVRQFGQIGDDYRFTLPSGKSVSFEDLGSANECKNHFVEHRKEIIQYTKGVQDIEAERNKMLGENREKNRPNSYH
jgi:hypothetical protein